MKAMELPMTKTAIVSNSRVLCSIFPVNAVMRGPPIATAKAYRVTNEPVEEIEIPRSEAIEGSNPTNTNSVVPMANAQKVNAQMANVILEGDSCPFIVQKFLRKIPVPQKKYKGQMSQSGRDICHGNQVVSLLSVSLVIPR